MSYRLLVTNTHTQQAYAIIRSLRPHASRIVATMYGARGRARLRSHAAYSRLVDARYTVPSPERDWQSGLITRENTDQEERYLRAIIEICERERLDTIFPSHDADVYVLSKNKPLLAGIGIRVPVPDFDTLRVSLDKQTTVALAEAVGFPCPKTYLPKTDADLAALAQEIDPPWVIKPRVTSASRGMRIVKGFDELRHEFHRVSERYRDPMVQEYIPGGQKQNFYVIVQATGAVWRVFCPEIVRHSRRLYRDSSAACVASDQHPALSLVVRLVQRMNWRGALTVQTKVDARDGTPKLMEINPRFGSHLWYRTVLGINDPLHCLRIEAGEALPEEESWTRGTLLLDPIEDAVGFCAELLDFVAYHTRVSLLRRKPTDTLSTPRGLSALSRAYVADYFDARPKKFSPYFTHFLSDLPPSLMYSVYTARYAPGGFRRMGR